MTSALRIGSSPARARARDRGRSTPRTRPVDRSPRAVEGEAHVLTSYVALAGAAREVVALEGAGGCTLVVDRDRFTRNDQRLVAHLSADEPAENAMIASALFARQASEQHVRCRPVCAEDFAARSSRECTELEVRLPAANGDCDVRDCAGRAYVLEAVAGAVSIPELRWRRHPPDMAGGEPCTVSVREAIGAVQAYEPIRALTRCALANDRLRGEVSVAVLRLELQRVLYSPIVLNCKLRETVLRLVGREGLSMSEIAMRCGRIKRDAGGSVSGETSWLGRRLGLLPEGGRAHITPWIHTDVLALIARRGLGVSPRDVEPD